MIKVIILDLDGVLIDIKDLHYYSLNKALLKAGDKYVISRSEHIHKFDGLKTREKLEILSRERNLPYEKHEEIFKEKQELTLKYLKNIEPSERLITMLNKLREKGYKIVCCTNSVKNTVFEVLSRLNIINLFELILSNDDVTKSKPAPEIYWKAMIKMQVLPEETLIIEDSPYGLLAAARSNAHVLRINNSKELTIENILSNISKIKANQISPKWVDKKLNILIPMAGAGSRFEKAGYKEPKPLIDVNGVPMIKAVTDNLNIDANFIYIAQKEHIEKYNLRTLLNIISPNCVIIETDGVTDGAARTSLLSKKFINNEHPLLIANSDQLIEWNSNDFFYRMYERQCDGCILTFTANNPKWSFARTNSEGQIIEVAEKKPISNNASVGIYYWRNGSDYVKYAEQMINKNIRTNNEFYICPVYNEAIHDNKMIIQYHIEKMHGLGTPEDLNNYLLKYGK